VASGKLRASRKSGALGCLRAQDAHARLQSSPGYLLAVRSNESLAMKVDPHQFDPRPLLHHPDRESVAADDGDRQRRHHDCHECKPNKNLSCLPAR
jgi:hypothetical protein